MAIFKILYFFEIPVKKLFGELIENMMNSLNPSLLILGMVYLLMQGCSSSKPSQDLSKTKFTFTPTAYERTKIEPNSSVIQLKYNSGIIQFQKMSERVISESSLKSQNFPSSLGEKGKFFEYVLFNSQGNTTHKGNVWIPIEKRATYFDKNTLRHESIDNTVFNFNIFLDRNLSKDLAKMEVVELVPEYPDNHSEDWKGNFKKLKIQTIHIQSQK